MLPNSITFRDLYKAAQSIQFTGPVFIVTGGPAVGKTTVGQLLEQRFGLSHFTVACRGRITSAMAKQIASTKGAVITFQDADDARYATQQFEHSAWLHIVRRFTEGLEARAVLRRATCYINDRTVSELHAFTLRWASENGAPPAFTTTIHAGQLPSQPDASDGTWRRTMTISFSPSTQEG